MLATLPDGAVMRLATRADISAIVDVYMDSFSTEIFSRQIFPRGAQSSIDFMTNTVTEEMDEPDAVWLVIASPPSSSASSADQAASQETIQGFLKWVRPGAPFPDADADADGYPPEGQPAIAADYFARVTAQHHERMRDTPHWYLDMMGVRRAAQGRGYAKAMVGWGVERSAEDGRPLYVDSTGDARGFYERMGFVRRGELGVQTPEGVAEIHIMLREA